MQRPSGRIYNKLREISFEPHYLKNSEGSCLIGFGNTKVICTATIEEKVPSFLKNKGMGWISAEYGMLPGSTNTRIEREAVKGKQTGRTQEIQRLIGRSLRAVTNLKALGERQVKIDCDVLEADGGTRTASINGAYIALFLALHKLHKKGVLQFFPINTEVAAISCGIYKTTPILDLDYLEDSNAEVDANFVLNGEGKLIEIQATAEQKPLSFEHLTDLMQLAKTGIQEIITLQRKTLLSLTIQ